MARKPKLHIPSSYAVRDPLYQRTVSLLLSAGITQGNKVTALQNGEAIFPAMLDEIKKATKNITLETFIYWSGSVGEEFAKVLAEKAAAGVKIHLLVDWYGSKKLEVGLVDRMEKAGVVVCKYHAPSIWEPMSLLRFNQRTHRKVLVIDGKVAFTGGVGIADDWKGNAEEPHLWRDSHYRIEGPAVSHLQSVFMDNWIKGTGEVLTGEDYFPELQEKGDLACQVFRSSPKEGITSVRLMYLLAMAAARHSIQISTPYFVPDALSVKHLCDAAKRGVRVDVMVPGPYIDFQVVRYGSRALWRPLLEAGIGIHEFQGSMLHHKLMVVDGYWTSVGSTNLDTRSLHLNDESNLNVFDEQFAQEQGAVFENDLKRCRQMTMERWKKRPLKSKIFEWFSQILRSQL